MPVCPVIVMLHDSASSRSGERKQLGSPGPTTHTGRTVPHALPADPGRALRHLDDGQLDRLRDAVAAGVRRRGRPDGRTPDRQTRRPASVTPGRERLVLATAKPGRR